MPACQGTESMDQVWRELEEGWRVRASVKSAARTDVCSPVQPLCKAASSKAGTANWTECQLDYEI